MVFSIFGSWQTSRQSEEAARQEQARLAELTPEQRAAETKRKQEAEAKAAAQKTEDEAAFNRAVATVKTLKDAARNPASFTAHNVLVMDGAKTVCVEYRAQNGFGGMNVGRAVLTSDAKLLTDDADGFSKSWNRECADKVGTDYTENVKYAIK